MSGRVPSGRNLTWQRPVRLTIWIFVIAALIAVWLMVLVR